MKLVGARAQNWLRQEKSYRAFGTELGRDATPNRGGPCRASSTCPRSSTANRRWRPRAIRSKCCTLLIDGPEDADPWGREALYHGDTKVGRLTSGGYPWPSENPSAWAMSNLISPCRAPS